MGQACCAEVKPDALEDDVTSERVLKPAGDPAGPVEAKVRACPQVRLTNTGYMLSQTFAVVRHADRLDHTEAWHSSPEALTYPNDTPLTQAGHAHATKAGENLASCGSTFGLIVSSPYYRCAQTASRIAEVLGVPVHFDLDLGEIFDDQSMAGDIADKPQHRDPQTLEQALKADFPAVQYIRDQQGVIRIEGTLQKFPEDFDAARMRFCYKVKKLVQRAARELMSIIIVTHGDALAAIVGLLKETWQSGQVPYTSYAICTRQLKVLEEGGLDLLNDVPVYEPEKQWKVTLSTGLVFNPIRGKKAQALAHQRHTQEMKAMNAQRDSISTDYVLDPAKEKLMQDTLNDMGATEGDMANVLKRAQSCAQFDGSRESSQARILCKPPKSATQASLPSVAPKAV